MKRQAFVLSGAGAALAGCAGTALYPNPLVHPAARSMASVTPADEDDQLLGSIMLLRTDLFPQHFEKCARPDSARWIECGALLAVGRSFRGRRTKDFGLPDMHGRAPRSNN